MQRFRQKIFIHNTIPPSFFRGYQEYRGKGKEEKKTQTNNKQTPQNKHEGKEECIYIIILPDTARDKPIGKFGLYKVISLSAGLAFHSTSL